LPSGGAEVDSNEIASVEQTGLGTIRIADDVVKVISGLAAMDIKGVAGMSGGFVGGIAELLGRKNLAKGIKVEVGEKEAAIDLSVIIDYGMRIPDVAAQIQESVKSAVERMTGLKVIEANVNVQGIAFADEAKMEEHRVK
jgi:uncharacterized alkaline shock family protein YloU